MIQITQWTPDTCENPPCILQYAWDDALPAEERIHHPHKIIRCCAKHQHDDVVKHYNAVLEHNQRKNQALGLLVEHTGEEHKDTRWEYYGDRLHVWSDKASTTHREPLQKAFDDKFGIGKVRVK